MTPDPFSSPWDEADRRPSHANRRKALLRTLILREELNKLTTTSSLPQKILQLTDNLVNLAAEHAADLQKCSLI